MQVIPIEGFSDDDRSEVSEYRKDKINIDLRSKKKRPSTNENNENKSDRSQLKDEADQSKLPVLPCCQCLSEGSGCCTSFAC